MQQTKTKTAIAVGIVALAVAGTVAGLMFMKKSSISSPAPVNNTTAPATGSAISTTNVANPVVSGLPAGCTSTSGYSPTTGKPCFDPSIPNIDLAFNKITKGEAGQFCMDVAGVANSSYSCNALTTDLHVYQEGLMHNGKPINVSMGVKNYGTSDSGSFTVKIWKSVDTIPGNVKQDASKDCEKNGIFFDRPDALLATWNIDSLKAGESIRKEFENLKTSGWPVHKYFNFIIEIDADDNVAETNESNNVFIRGCIPQSR